jgi:hypothetical protein
MALMVTVLWCRSNMEEHILTCANVLKTSPASDIHRIVIAATEVRASTATTGRHHHNSCRRHYFVVITCTNAQLLTSTTGIVTSAFACSPSAHHSGQQDLSFTFTSYMASPPLVLYHRSLFISSPIPLICAVALQNAVVAETWRLGGSIAISNPLGLSFDAMASKWDATAAALLASKMGTTFLPPYPRTTV